MIVLTLTTALVHHAPQMVFAMMMELAQQLQGIRANVSKDSRLESVQGVARSVRKMTALVALAAGVELALI